MTDHPDWDVKTEIAGETQAASTVVKAGGTASINVTAEPPEDAAAGQYAVHVEVKAGEQTIPGDFKVTITGSYSLTLATPEPGALGSRRRPAAPTSQQFIVTNTGTAPIDAVKLTATPPTDWTVTFDPDTLPRSPRALGDGHRHDHPVGDAVAGDYDMTFKARQRPGETRTPTSGSRSRRRRSGRSSGIGIIVAILGGLFYVFRTYGRR